MNASSPHQRRGRRRARGFALLEGLISIAVLGFGVLGMARFQVDVVKQTTDAQNRLVAADLADALLSYVRVDPGHAACYTVPQVGPCLSPSAAALAAGWSDEAAARGFTSASATLDATRLVATLGWTSRAFNVARHLEVATDVRP